MAEQLKPPKKGILKNSTSFDKTERKSSLKETKWDEMNIIATFHPADKDYGHMKIEEPKTPYNYACPDEAAEAAEAIDSDVLAQKIRLGADQPPKAMEQVEEDEEENMTDEQRGGSWSSLKPDPNWLAYALWAESSSCRRHRVRMFVRRRHRYQFRCRCRRRVPLRRPADGDPTPGRPADGDPTPGRPTDAEP